MNCHQYSVRTFQVFLLTASIAALTFSGCKLDSLFKSKTSNDFAASLEDEADRIKKHAQGPNWLTSVDIAMNVAKNQNKLVMAVMTGTDWCPFCVRLEKEVFEQPEFRDWANQNVVPLFLDYPNPSLKKKLSPTLQSMKARYQKDFSGYPTILFLDSRGQVVAKMGYSKGGAANWIAKAEERLDWK